MLPAWIRRAAPDEDGQQPGRRLRSRSIRSRIVALLVIPLISLVGLWGFAASMTVGAAVNKVAVSTTYNKIGSPGAYLSIQIQTERALSIVVLASHGRMGVGELGAQRARTNAAQAGFVKSAMSASVQDSASPTVQQRLNDFIQQLGRLVAARSLVDNASSPSVPGGSPDLMPVFGIYNDINGSAYQLFESLTIIDDLGIFRQGGALITNTWAREFMLREDALVTALLSTKTGRMTVAEHTAFVGWMATARQAMAVSLADLSGNLRAPMTQITESAQFQSLRGMEDDIAATRPGTRLPTSVNNWPAVAEPLLGNWAVATEQVGATLLTQSQPIGDKIVIQLIVAGGFGLVAVALSIGLSILFVRRISRELGGLQQAARELAEDRLPDVVARLRRGEDVDVGQHAPPLAVGKTTEISRVAQAFGRVQRTAIDTAVGEAYLRKGISRVFLNLAWRSQSLLHRQLRMLDAMERRAAGPEELEDLFRLDHLTTRMRRHAEGLVILSGATPSRSWSRPVQVIDVLRGAVAEVEDYTRVDVVASAPVALAGTAVADVIHLLAELVENATAFSPPPTEVLVRGELVANGFAVEVVDRGIGLSPAELDQLNERLLRPPEFDLADSDRLGLFVVSRLAARHGIRVTLGASPYGGTTAVLLIPRALVVESEELEAGDGRSALAPAPAAIAAGPRAWFEPAETHTEPYVEPYPEVAVKPFDADEEGVLPHRVRQASLVPQLRSKAPAPTGPYDDGAALEREPEEARDLMSSLQTGWLRGRSDDDDDDQILFNERKEWGES
jgi:signal transduction histidine kinase